MRQSMNEHVSWNISNFQKIVGVSWYVNGKGLFEQYFVVMSVRDSNFKLLHVCGSDH